MEESPDPVASLRQLDPSPIDSPSPLVEKNKQLHDNMLDADLQNSKGSYRTRSPTDVGLHGSKTSIYYLSRIQKYSSYAMFLFTSLHLTNVSLIPAITRSVPASETYLLMTREIYQTPLTEPLFIVLPAVAHVGSGVALRLIRRAQHLRRYGGSEMTRDDRIRSGRWSAWPPLSYISLSGYAFSVAFTAHAFTNRVVPLLVEGDSSNVGLGYVAHGFAQHPWTSSLAYVSLIAVGCGHMVWGAARWLGQAPSTQVWRERDSIVMDKSARKQRRRKWLSVQGLNLFVTALWMAGGLGVVARGGSTSGWLGKVYDQMFAYAGL